jgi:xylan 1,4-beta-xylosidase
VNPDQQGSTETVRLTFKGIRPNSRAAVSRVDDEHANTLAAYKAMGSPLYPTDDQISRLNAETALRQPDTQPLDGDHLDLVLKPNALALVEVKSGS